MGDKRAVRKRCVEWADRFFFVMKTQGRSRLWELKHSERKLSAQMVEIKPPEREALMRRIDR